MAYTEIAVTDLKAFATSVTLTGTTGDATNDHDMDGDAVPRLHLVCSNSHASAVTFKVVTPAITSRGGGRIGATSNVTTVTVPAAAAGVEGKSLVIYDSASVLWRDTDNITGEAIIIESDDANLNLCTFYAYTWTPTSVT